jgi:hypothetical protein
MFLVGLLSWWYGRGWLSQLNKTSGRWHSTVEYFSIGQLFATLFAPFRQISATNTSSPNPVEAMRALFDQLISRLIGGLVRSFTIFIGIAAIILQFVYGSIILMLWFFVPLVPLIGFVLLAIGWAPSWM